jgi:hypothetical protein
LEHHSFKALKIYPCLLICDNCILLVYTNNCIILGHDQTTIDKLKTTLTEVDGSWLPSPDKRDPEQLSWCSHEDAHHRHLRQELYMTQTSLIDMILTNVGLISDPANTSCSRSQPTTKYVPATTVLCSDPDAAPFKASWSYCSIIGKLNFLAQNTQPDIAFAVHQCAQFVSNPNQTHQATVKHLCRYILGTQDKGLVLRTNCHHCLTAYVDADFAGLWHKDYAHLHGTALSCTGVILCYANCPIIWTSKLQSEVELVTCEAEYIALSMCAHLLIPMQTLLNEVSWFQPPAEHPTLTKTGSDKTTLMLCKQHQPIVYEDNTGTLKIANSDLQYCPRTKHISIKWHCFCDHVASGLMTVAKINTTLQWANFLTKPLPQVSFECLQKLVMGL